MAGPEVAASFWNQTVARGSQNILINASVLALGTEGYQGGVDWWDEDDSIYFQTFKKCFYLKDCKNFESLTKEQKFIFIFTNESANVT